LLSQEQYLENNIHNKMEAKFLLGIFAVFLVLFSLSSVATEYPYWIEHNEGETILDNVLVKLDSIPASSTKTIYAIKTAGYSPSLINTFGSNVLSLLRLNNNLYDSLGYSSFLYSGSISYTNDKDGNSNSALSLSYSGYIYSSDSRFSDLGSDEFSISMWFKSENPSGNAFHIINKRSTADPYQGFAVYQEMRTGKTVPQYGIGFYLDAGASGYTLKSNAISNGVWHHLVAIKTSNEIKLYIDNTLVDSTSVTADVSNSNSLKFGANKDGANQWTGAFDNIYVYDRALSTDEIDNLYKEGLASIVVYDLGQYYQIDITNNQGYSLSNYIVPIDTTSLSITSTSQSIRFTNESPTFLGNIVIFLNDSNIFVNERINVSCFWQNSTPSPDDVNLTISLIDINTSQTLTSQTFISVNESEVKSIAYTITQSNAHHLINATCSYVDDLSNIGSTSDSFIINNSAPQWVTDYSITQTPWWNPEDIYVNTTVTFSDCGVVDDPDGDPISWYWSAERQDAYKWKNFSTDNTWIVPVEAAHQPVYFFCYAQDSYGANSTRTQNPFGTHILNTPPVIQQWSVPSYIYGNTPFIANYTIFDIDNDTMDLRVQFKDGDEEYTYFYDQNQTGQLNLTYTKSSYDEFINVTLIADDGYGGNDTNTTTTFVKYGLYTLRFLDEATGNDLNLNVVTDAYVTVVCDDNSETNYFITGQDQQIEVNCSLQYMRFTFPFSDRNLIRGRVASPGVQNFTVWMIDLSKTPYVVDTIYFNGLDNVHYVKLSTVNEGEITSQLLDLTLKSDLFMISGKPYYLTIVYNDGSIKDLGTIYDIQSSVRYFVSNDWAITTIDDLSEINLGISSLDSAVFVSFTDSQGQTTSLKTIIYNESNDVVCEFNHVDIGSVVNMTCYTNTTDKIFTIKTNFTRNGKLYEIVKYLRNGALSDVPPEIPTWFFNYTLFGILFVMFVLANALTAPFLTFFALILANIINASYFFFMPWTYLIILDFVAIVFVWRSIK